MRVQFGERHIYKLLFADDQIILAEDEDDANYMMRKFLKDQEKAQ